MKRRTIYKLLPGLLAVSLLVPYPTGAASLNQELQAAVQEVPGEDEEDLSSGETQREEEMEQIPEESLE